jgi:hypothetical protein
MVHYLIKVVHKEEHHYVIWKNIYKDFLTHVLGNHTACLSVHI